MDIKKQGERERERERERATKANLSINEPQTLCAIAKIDSLTASECGEVVHVRRELLYTLVRTFEPPIDHIDAI